ncbi:hypothetical protein D3C84_645040 [compost metagenome]
MDMDVEGVAFQFVVETVDAVLELLGRQHAPTVVQQGLQQRLFAARKVHRLTGEHGFAAAGVVRQRAVFDQVDAAPRHPAQQGVQPCSEFAQVERFEQVVVSAGLQAINTISDRVPRRENQHRQFQTVVAQLLQQFQAVFIGQSEVEHHHVELGYLEHGPRRRRRGDVFHGQALGGQAGNDAAGDQLIVFANQYVHGEPLVNKAD